MEDSFITGWKAGWVDRTLPAFVYYALGMLTGLIIIIGIISVLNIRDMEALRHELTGTSATDRASLFSRFNKSVQKACRRHYAVAWAFLANFFVITLVDGYISADALAKDTAEHPEFWTPETTTRIFTYVSIFAPCILASFFLVPLTQLLLATWALSRLARENGDETLSNYIPTARIYSTHAAQLWAMACFGIMAFWPSFDRTPLRWVILEACIGSAIAWLDASTMFNFASDRLGEVEVQNSHLRGIIRLFAKTAYTGHTFEKTSDLLPPYEDTPKRDSINDKSQLLVETHEAAQ